MEYCAVKIANPNSELYHFGIKGMKWGVRRYQNKDGSLTPAGQSRYNKAVETMNDSNASKRAKKKAEATVKKLGPAKKITDDKESVEVKRERLLKSTDAKEIYENRHLLSTNELNERINRIDTEARLKSKIVQDHEKTGVDYLNDRMKNTTNTINNAANFFKSVDSAFSAVANSSIGKTLAKQLGIEVPKKEFDLDDFIKNINKKSTQEVMDAYKRITADEGLRKKAAERKSQSTSESKTKTTESTKTTERSNTKKNDNNSGTDTNDNSRKSRNETPKKEQTERTEQTETWTGTVEGQGTSRYMEREGPIYDAEFTEMNVSGVPAVITNTGRSRVDDMLNRRLIGG